jgi:hypothetical protein
LLFSLFNSDRETTVIDEDLIKTAYEEERESLKNADIAMSDTEREPMTMPEIINEATTLRLSFRSISCFFCRESTTH